MLHDLRLHLNCLIRLWWNKLSVFVFLFFCIWSCSCNICKEFKVVVGNSSLLIPGYHTIFCYFPVNCESYVCDPQPFCLWHFLALECMSYNIICLSHQSLMGNTLEPYAYLLEAKGYVTSINIWIMVEFFKILPLYTNIMVLKSRCDWTFNNCINYLGLIGHSLREKFAKI